MELGQTFWKDSTSSIQLDSVSVERDSQVNRWWW